MSDVAALFDAALRQAGVPIVGVSIARSDDRATWEVQYAPAATAQQRAAGELLKATFNPDDPAVLAMAQAAQAQIREGDPLIQAVTRALWEEIQKCTPLVGQTLLTQTQLRARVRTLLGQLLT
jgi:hypothetical protein